MLLCVNFSLVAVIYRCKLMHVWTQELGNNTKACKENHMHLNMLSTNNEISAESFKILKIDKASLSLIISHLSWISTSNFDTKIKENMILIDQLIVLLPYLNRKVDSFTVWATREAPNYPLSWRYNHISVGLKLLGSLPIFMLKIY